MSKLYVIQGRAGDLICQLPMLHADYKKTGSKTRAMIAKEFAGVLDGCSYVEPIIFDGDYRELGKAVKLARTMSDDVVVTSIHGSKEDVEKLAYGQIGQKTASAENFQQEAWKLAGRLDDWHECLPLVFDRRNPEREDRLLRANGFKNKGHRKPVILLAVDGGLTAPFPYAHLLKELVTLKFGKDYRVIDVPMVEQPDGRIYDLLALYENAALLIAIDSQCLHLAMACPKLPVFALANDRPTLWHGAAWRPNHLWFCRYHDWPERAVEMCRAIGSLELSKPQGEFVSVQFSPEKPVRIPTAWPHYVDVTRGMCGRDADGFPFVKDVIRMGLQRAGDLTPVSLTRFGCVFNESNPCKVPRGTFFAYRIQKGQFHPIVDLFSAPRAFWKKIMPEIPDLILDDGSEWGEALMVIFRKYGAVDSTGCAEFVGGEK